MNIFSVAYNEILYKPLFNFLVFLYNILPWQDIGIAIILLTLFIKLILFPLSKKSFKTQRMMGAIQSEIKKIKEKNKGNKEAEIKEAMELYRKYKVNPFSGCLPILIQLPIIFALYKVFLKGLSNSGLEGLYSFVANPGIINPVFLGFINLSQASVYFAALAAALQFIQSKFMKKVSSGFGDNEAAKKSSDISKVLGFQMTYFLPLFTFFIGLKLPAGLMLFWTFSILFSIGEQLIISKKESKPYGIQ